MEFEHTRSALESFAGKQVSIRGVTTMGGCQVTWSELSAFGVLSLGPGALDAHFQSSSLRQSVDDGETILVLQRSVMRRAVACFVLYAEDFVEAHWIEIDGQAALELVTDNHHYTVSRGPGLYAEAVRSYRIALNRLRGALRP